jgi:hypothetical protein
VLAALDRARPARYQSVHLRKAHKGSRPGVFVMGTRHTTPFDGAHSSDATMLISWAITNEVTRATSAAKAAVSSRSGASYRRAQAMNVGGSHPCVSKRGQVERLQNRIFAGLCDPDDSGGVGRGES